MASHSARAHQTVWPCDLDIVNVASANSYCLLDPELLCFDMGSQGVPSGLLDSAPSNLSLSPHRFPLTFLPFVPYIVKNRNSLNSHRSALISV